MLLWRLQTWRRTLGWLTVRKGQKGQCDGWLREKGNLKKQFYRRQWQHRMTETWPAVYQCRHRQTHNYLASCGTTITRQPSLASPSVSSPLSPSPLSLTHTRMHEFKQEQERESWGWRHAARSGRRDKGARVPLSSHPIGDWQLWSISGGHSKKITSTAMYPVSSEGIECLANHLGWDVDTTLKSW